MSDRLDQKRAVIELKKLRSLTGNPDGAQRVDLTTMWLQERAWLRGRVEAISGSAACIDEAGGVSMTLWGVGEHEPLIGAQVDWADEEGARFGEGLFGYSTCAGTPATAEDRGLKDQAGVELPAALAWMPDEAKVASKRLAREGSVPVSRKQIWHVAHRPFFRGAIGLCEEAIATTRGLSHRCTSGALHDATETCGEGVPPRMIWVQGPHWISRRKSEETREASVQAGGALARFADKTEEWIASRN